MTNKDNEANIANEATVKEESREFQLEKELEKQLEEAMEKAIEKAEIIGAKTVVNYVPLGNEIVLRWEADITKSDLLSPKIPEVFKAAMRVRFYVAAYGNEVKHLSIGDTVNIKNTEGLSLNYNIYNKLSIAILRDKYRKDRDAMISHSIKSSEDPKHVGVGAAISGVATEPDKIIQFKEDTVKIVEHFITDNFNVCGIMFLLDDIRKS